MTSLSNHHFFAFISRLKLIQRWSLMRCHHHENVAEHSLQVAQVAHCIALKKQQQGDTSVNPERIAILAIYHDASEVLTGDLPTPIKYANPAITEAYKKVEDSANLQLLGMLPNELKAYFQTILTVNKQSDKANMALLKKADTVCALLKCKEEIAAGNHEFVKAEKALIKRIKQFNDLEVNWFIDQFAASFALSLDEMKIADFQPEIK